MPVSEGKGTRVPALRLGFLAQRRGGADRGAERGASTTPRKPTPHKPATASSATESASSARERERGSETASKESGEVLQRAERAMGILDDFILKSARSARCVE